MQLRSGYNVARLPATRQKLFSPSFKYSLTIITRHDTINSRRTGNNRSGTPCGADLLKQPLRDIFVMVHMRSVQSIPLSAPCKADCWRCPYCTCKLPLFQGGVFICEETPQPFSQSTPQIPLNLSNLAHFVTNCHNSLAKSCC